MKPWELLDEETVVGSGASLQLFRRDGEYSIRVDRAELMNSRMHGSEDELARLGCRALTAAAPRVLVGGLGLGFTLAEVLRHLPRSGAGQVVVAELVPAVVRWNREVLGHLAGEPLADPRVRVEIRDVGALIGAAVGAPAVAYDAILLDVDNGPDGLTRRENEALYSRAGLQRISGALRPGGVLTVWSAAADERFKQRLSAARFSVEEHRVRARAGRGARHWIWVATRPGR